MPPRAPTNASVSPPLPSTLPNTTNPTEAPLSSTTFTRPIALTSPQDLSYLRALALRAARAKIDLHLPPHANSATSTPSGAGNALRADVERRVDAWLAALFAAVADNVAVNGIPASRALASSSSAAGAGAGAGADAGTEGEEYEAYDAPLAGSLTAAHARIEALHAALAEQRRDAAARGAGDFAAAFAEWDAQLGAREEAATAARLARGQDADAGAGGLAVPFTGREERVQSAFEQAVENVRAARGGLEGAGERAGEARKVVEYLRPAS